MSCAGERRDDINPRHPTDGAAAKTSLLTCAASLEHVWDGSAFVRELPG